ncbi:hypothetical protein SLS53_001723 [Cytospora paraplurivora]|uniref:Uncharacterized protein n=1 Tax=Cytospora paraplurivora TaxID=2898453 RepID=A0AAN9YJL0_9PEZI
MTTGVPPKWESPPLPFQIPEDVMNHKSRWPLNFDNGKVVEKYLWKLPLMAVQASRPDFPFNHVDVMITAKRLEGFWKYCQGASAQDIAANATVINNTLFIDGFEPVGLETGSELDRPSLYATCGNSWPLKYLDSFMHHRVLFYQFGSLNIVVVGSVMHPLMSRLPKSMILVHTTLKGTSWAGEAFTKHGSVAVPS